MTDEYKEKYDLLLEAFDLCQQQLKSDGDSYCMAGAVMPNFIEAFRSNDMKKVKLYIKEIKEDLEDPW